MQGCKPSRSVLNPYTTSVNNSENPPTAYRKKTPTSITLSSTKPNENRTTKVRQITHKEITTHKRAQVIVTMHASKLKIETK
jgi:hypothetical protein